MMHLLLRIRFLFQFGSRVKFKGADICKCTVVVKTTTYTTKSRQLVDSIMYQKNVSLLASLRLFGKPGKTCVQDLYGGDWGLILKHTYFF